MYRGGGHLGVFAVVLSWQSASANSHCEAEHRVSTVTMGPRCTQGSQAERDRSTFPWMPALCSGRLDRQQCLVGTGMTPQALS